jgi:protein-disulfide isomerase
MAAKKKRREQPGSARGISTGHILLVVGAAILVVAVLVILNANSSTPSVARELPYQTGVTPEGEPYKGSPDAPLKLVEYSDFLCSHCGNFADTIGNLRADYIETGKLQVVFRNYAFLAPESVQSAQAAECALEQGADKFWQYHDLLFANRGTGLGAYTNSRLITYAQEIGLNVSDFRSCVTSEAKAREVQADIDEGISLGVSSTPTWFLNGEMIRGALPEPDVRQLLDRKLTEGSSQ